MKKLFRCEDWETCPDISIPCQNRFAHIHEHPSYADRGCSIGCPAIPEPDAEDHIRNCVLFAEFEENAPERAQDAQKGCPFSSPRAFCGDWCAVWLPLKLSCAFSIIAMEVYSGIHLEDK